MYMGKTIAIIQARMGSTRLPGKIIRKLDGRPIYRWVYDRLSFAKGVNQIVFATTNLPIDDTFSNSINHLGIGLIRGSEDDVLSRYYDAALKFDADTVVRITCDCPFIDGHLLDEGLTVHAKNDNHYSSNVIPPTFPDGFDFEIFSFEILKEAYKNASSPHEREHVTTWIIKNIDKKNAITHCSNTDKHALKRVTLDNQADFDLLDQLVSNYGVNVNSSVEEIIEILDQNPDLQKINNEFNARKAQYNG